MSVGQIRVKGLPKVEAVMDERFEDDLGVSEGTVGSQPKVV